MMVAVTVSVSDNTHYAAVPRQLLTCLDTTPDGRDRPQMKNGRDDDRLAAVLVPLIWRESDWQILMTKRAAHLSHHAGQISFPGGALDNSDKGLIDTALREAHEEICLPPSSVRVNDKPSRAAHWQQAAHNPDRWWWQTDLFMRLTQRSINQPFVAGIKRSAGKTDLPCMMR